MWRRFLVSGPSDEYAQPDGHALAHRDRYADADTYSYPNAEADADAQTDTEADAAPYSHDATRAARSLRACSGH